MEHCEFRRSNVHGWGVFAAKDIAPGTQLLEEPALWVVDKKTAIMGSFPTSPDDVSEMRGVLPDSFSRCCMALESREEQQERCQLLLRLCGGFTNDEMTMGVTSGNGRILAERLREILILNAVDQKSGGQSEWAAVFRGASRLNHSCCPNAERTIVSVADAGKTKYCCLFVRSHIKKGEEIFINYVDPLAESNFRQEMFQTRWHFTCTCQLRTRPEKDTEASDKRREKMDNAIRLMQKCEQMHSAPKEDWQSVEAYNIHVQNCDQAALGVAGWKVLADFAATENVNDLKLYGSMRIASDAACRLKKLSLETNLVDRMTVVCTTFGFGPVHEKHLRERRKYLHDTANTLANVVAATMGRLGG